MFFFFYRNKFKFAYLRICFVFITHIYTDYPDFRLFGLSLVPDSSNKRGSAVFVSIFLIYIQFSNSWRMGWQPEILYRNLNSLLLNFILLCETYLAILFNFFIIKKFFTLNQHVPISLKVIYDFFLNGIEILSAL